MKCRAQIWVPAIEYTATVTVALPRHANVFEEAILRVCAQLANHQDYGSYTWRQVFEELLHVPQADRVVGPVLQGLIDLGALSTNTPGQELMDIPVRRFQIRSQGQQLLERGELPANPQEYSVTVYYDPIEHRVLDRVPLADAPGEAALQPPEQPVEPREHVRLWLERNPTQYWPASCQILSCRLSALGQKWRCVPCVLELRDGELVFQAESSALAEYVEALDAQKAAALVQHLVEPPGSVTAPVTATLPEVDLRGAAVGEGEQWTTLRDAFEQVSRSSGVAIVHAAWAECLKLSTPRSSTLIFAADGGCQHEPAVVAERDRVVIRTERRPRMAGFVAATEDAVFWAAHVTVRLARGTARFVLARRDSEPHALAARADFLRSLALELMRSGDERASLPARWLKERDYCTLLVQAARDHSEDLGQRCAFLTDVLTRLPEQAGFSPKQLASTFLALLDEQQGPVPCGHGIAVIQAACRLAGFAPGIPRRIADWIASRVAAASLAEYEQLRRAMCRLLPNWRPHEGAPLYTESLLREACHAIARSSRLPLQSDNKLEEILLRLHRQWQQLRSRLGDDFVAERFSADDMHSVAERLLTDPQALGSAQAFLALWQRACGRFRLLAKAGAESALGQVIDRLERLVQQWDELATERPIRVLFDTSALMVAPEALRAVKHCEVLIPSVVLEELDELKTRWHKQQAARKAIRLLEELRPHLRIVPVRPDQLPAGASLSADNLILSAAMASKDQSVVVLVSEDRNLRVKATGAGIHAMTVDEFNGFWCQRWGSSW